MGCCQYEANADAMTPKLDEVVLFSSHRDILLKLYGHGSFMQS